MLRALGDCFSRRGAGSAINPNRAALHGKRNFCEGLIKVVTPALPTRFQWLASATDKAREEADDRLQAVLGQIEELGTRASGTVGADDPLLAFEDALAGFHADHILVWLRPPDRADWQERGLLDELLSRFGIPVTVFSLGE